MSKKVTSIYEIADLNSKSITKDDTPNSIYYLDTSNITRNRIDNLKYLQLSKEEYPSRAKRKVKDKTIVYSTVRPNQEHFGILDNPIENLIVSTGFTTIDIKDINVIDPLYLYYYITQKRITNHLQAIAENSVSSYPSINSSDIGELIITFPLEIKEQQKKITLLSSIDKKIELNNRINAELEAMAKTLYDYWFVQFDFPNEDGKPYKSSGGKMVYNTTLKQEIPDGWIDKQLNSVVERIGTGLNPRDNFKLGEGNNYYITIKDIEQGRIIFSDKTDRVSDVTLDIINKRSDIKVGDILFTSIQPVGLTYLIHEKPVNWNINESVFTIRANQSLVTSEYLFKLLSSEQMKVFSKNSSSGSIHKGIRHGVLKNFVFAYANLSVIKKFTVMITPILQKQYKLEIENNNLQSLRDFLLPMLMNGQVTVK